MSAAGGAAEWRGRPRPAERAARDKLRALGEALFIDARKMADDDEKRFLAVTEISRSRRCAELPA